MPAVVVLVPADVVATADVVTTPEIVPAERPSASEVPVHDRPRSPSGHAELTGLYGKRPDWLARFPAAFPK